MSSRSLFLVAILLTSLFGATTSVDAVDFKLQNGDRVAFVGNTLIEREQTYGLWEWGLTVAAVDRQIKFRNLGWSGDTVWSDSRGIFDAPSQGYGRLLELVKELQPTVVVCNYGAVEAFNGEARLQDFTTQYARLLADLRAAAAPSARFVLLAPLQLQPSAPVPQPETYNAQVAVYRSAIEELATREQAVYVPLKMPGGDVTDNGQHLNRLGYLMTGRQLVGALCPEGADKVQWPQVAAEPADDSPHGKLLSAIRAKNELFFHRWRPQNVTYLFLFRKHEQGNNAVEIPQFDPLIAQWEEKITQLKQAPR